MNDYNNNFIKRIHTVQPIHNTNVKSRDDKKSPNGVTRTDCVVMDINISSLSRINQIN